MGASCVGQFMRSLLQAQAVQASQRQVDQQFKALVHGHQSVFE
jgi:hypothetical protein